MGLDLGGGDYLPMLVLKAQKEKFQVIEDKVVSDINIDGCIFHLTDIETGWGRFVNNKPEWSMDPSLTSKAPQPANNDGEDANWKRGFCLKVTTPEGKELELKTTQVAANRAIQKLYAEFEKNGGLENPIVKLTGFDDKSVRNSSVPLLEVAEYVGADVADALAGDKPQF